MSTQFRWIVPLGVFTLLGSMASAQAVLSVDPVSQTVAPGTDFTVDVNISNVSDLYGYQFDLTFNPNVIAAVSSSEGSFLATGGNTTFFIPGTNDNLDGTVSATADTILGPGPGVSGSGEIVAFTFDALKAGTSSLDIVNETLLDSNLNIISDSTVGASITVGPATSAAPEIDAGSTPSAVLMLLGGLAILRASRRPTLFANGQHS
jgi:hypothetical protein